MRIPVLTYHATNISGNSYQSNDLLAFEEDLQLIHQLGVNILSTYDLLKWIEGDLTLNDSQHYVVITFDDGSELDFYDWQHPTYGQQQSFYSTLKSYPNYAHTTSFVIASPDTRSVLVDTCTAGHSIWGDDWWQKAEKSGLLSIENHSWDHLHETLDIVAQQNNEKGDFSKITSLEDANAQINEASQYIDSQIDNKQVTLFAYPYGDYNRYLTEDYFPNQQSNIKAAFTCEAKHVTQETNNWKIPRYVCGLHWKTNAELKNLLFSQ